LLRISKEGAIHIKKISHRVALPGLSLKKSQKTSCLSLKKEINKPFWPHPEVAEKTMNKEERYSHLIAAKHWMVYFSPYLRCTPQGMRKKGKI
jgi:hypothetical protein